MKINGVEQNILEKNKKSDEKEDNGVGKEVLKKDDEESESSKSQKMLHFHTTLMANIFFMDNINILA